jgi:hypothetical protein
VVGVVVPDPLLVDAGAVVEGVGAVVGGADVFGAVGLEPARTDTLDRWMVPEDL